MLTVVSRHGEGFDLVAAENDLTAAPHGASINGYAAKVMALREFLQIGPVCWTVLEGGRDRALSYFETGKPMEWVLRVSRSRVVGFVRCDLWSEYLRNWRPTLTGVAYRGLPKKPTVALLIELPIRPEEVEEIRRLAPDARHRPRIVERFAYGTWPQ
jgi:hypothetical protein